MPVKDEPVFIELMKKYLSLPSETVYLMDYLLHTADK
jgi:hypothetical protein